MTEMSDYYENELLDHSLGTGALTAPSNIYLALFTTDPTDAGSGTEVSGSGYARQTITFGAASGGTADSSNSQSFTASGGNFGTVTHIGLYDALTNGNLLYHTPINSDQVVNDGQTLSFGSGDVTVTLA